ncbi:hypothetical protein Tco_1548799 [Tanacetum coccineum]
MHTECGDGIAITKRRHQDFHIDGVTDLATASEHPFNVASCEGFECRDLEAAFEYPVAHGLLCYVLHVYVVALFFDYFVGKRFHLICVGMNLCVLWYQESGIGDIIPLNDYVCCIGSGDTFRLNCDT